MYIRYLLVLLGLITLTPVVIAADTEMPQSEVLEQIGVPTGGDFTLDSINGPVSTETLRGQVVMLYFGYTKCPDVCPFSLSFMTQALNELSDKELEGVTSMFISVDPKRDTVELLDKYVNYFHKDIIGVTGTPEQVEEVASNFGAQYREVELPGSAFGYSVNHSSATYLIDKRGELKFVFPHGTIPTIILEGLRLLLAESDEPGVAYTDNH